MPEPRAVVTNPEPIRVERRLPGRRCFVGAGIFVILLCFAGFGPSLIDGSRRSAPVTPLLLWHGATALAWLLLFVAQASLVAT